VPIPSLFEKGNRKDLEKEETMLIIGESINGTIPKVGQAIQGKNETFLKELARIQVECGAQMLDVNAGVAGGNEVEDLPWLIQLIQKGVSVPLMIDSSNPEALKAGLSVYQHQEAPILNSISGEKEKWSRLFPIVVEKKCKIVVLCMDDQGIPETVKERVVIATQLFNDLTQGGIPPHHIYLDPLVLPVGVEPEAATITLETMRAFRTLFSNSHIICGASNVSMGLPGRKLINRTFLTMAILAGLDTLLIDVRDQALMSSIYTSEILTNRDPYCTRYLKAYRAKKILI
jgi:5-methyltetrahydrofolate--homocysteine methyltransferase